MGHIPANHLELSHPRAQALSLAFLPYSLKATCVGHSGVFNFHLSFWLLLLRHCSDARANTIFTDQSRPDLLSELANPRPSDLTGQFDLYNPDGSFALPWTARTGGQCPSTSPGADHHAAKTKRVQQSVLEIGERRKHVRRPRLERSGFGPGAPFWIAIQVRAAIWRPPFLWLRRQGNSRAPPSKTYSNVPPSW
jgi:hypothetical protein